MRKEIERFTKDIKEYEIEKLEEIVFIDLDCLDITARWNRRGISPKSSLGNPRPDELFYLSKNKFDIWEEVWYTV